ncbi:helix-turn-helix domain-containing protein [Kordia sp.]|uniref:helix-turn-helix domain-containing protein n=1 Tax=Kordia sp. TaxID=1965332 RepID=UPI003B5A36EE
MKNIYNLIIILVFSTLLAGSLQAAEKTSGKTRLVSLQTTDNIQTHETAAQMMVVLAEKQQVFETRCYILIGLALFLILLFGMLCFFKKRNDKRLDTIITLLERYRAKGTTDDENKDPCIEIDEEIVAEILENLKAFELENGFLTSKITLHEFAKQMQTNTKYLSKVINTYKMKSFRNYINDLRIQYSIKKLQNNPSYRKYTVSALATEAGFSTKQSFTNAFQRKTGKTVSSYIEQLN